MLANELNSIKCVEDHSSLISASLCNEESRSRNLLCSYPVVAESLLKIYSTDQVIAGNDAAVLIYLQPFNLSPQEYAGRLVTKFCKIADLYDVNSLNKVTIKSIDVFIRHSPHNYLAETHIQK